MQDEERQPVCNNEPADEGLTNSDCTENENIVQAKAYDGQGQNDGQGVQENGFEWANPISLTQKNPKGSCYEEGYVGEVNEDCYRITLADLTYSERLKLISCIIEYLNSQSAPMADLLFDSGFISAFPILKGYSNSAAWDICGSAAFTKEQQNNVSLAVIIFYILTKGRYPQDVWGGSVMQFGDTGLGEFSLKGKEYASTTRKTICDRKSTELLGFVRQTRREQKKRDIDGVIADCRGVGAVKLFEMLWEVFITKYGNYDVRLWSKKIAEFRRKTYLHRCEYAQSNDIAEIYAVSSEGRLDKPLHNGCEDCSFVSVYDETTWLAAVADGVGSCVNSALGSETATVVLAETIVNYLQDKGFIGPKKKWFPKRITESDWAELMYFFKFRLPQEFYDGWENSIKRTRDYAKSGSSDLSGFSTTLNFAFGCEKFVVCGRLGDGCFYVRKNERIGSEELFGGVYLNDGFSGVTRQEVFTVPNLKSNPQTMAVDFFNADEISDIVLTTDGMAGAMGETVKQTDTFVSRLSEMPFDSRCRELQNCADLCADYNETHNGSGDDSTIAFIHFKK